MKEQISITLDEDLLEQIDERRGRIPRSPYIEDLIRESLEESEDG